MAVTVLVSSAGSTPAVGVIRALRQQTDLDVRIVAVDMNPLSVGFHLSDRHFTVPPADDPTFMDRVLGLCEREHVRVVFPTVDDELLAFAVHRDRFAAKGIGLVTNEPATVRRARDKIATYRFCREHDIAVPLTLLASELPHNDLPEFPLIVKPRTGWGTQHVFKAENREELDFFVRYVPNAIVQQFIEGQEYTIDVLTDLDGQVISIVPKARMATKAGMQVKGRTVRDERLLEYATVVNRKFRLAPRANIQCIMRDGHMYLIEVNPKFPGSLPLTVAAGVNVPLLLVKMYLGERIAPMVGRFRDGLMMLRHWEEVFVEVPAAVVRGG